MKTFFRKDSWNERDYYYPCSTILHHLINPKRLIKDIKKNT